jgi:hypothetical protein
LRAGEKVKAVISSSSATLTIIMILILIGFLTLMVYLAGLRWDRQEGRGKEARES